MLIFNNFKIALRNTLRNKLFSSINIIGLVLGLTCCLLITLYIIQEKSFDKYHKDVDRIYRIVADAKINSMEFSIPSVHYPLAKTIANEIPGVETITRITKEGYKVIDINKQYYKEKVFKVDSTFFDVFTVDFLLGTKYVLNDAKNIILNETTAKKYYGSINKAFLNTIKIESNDYTVAAIVKDCPHNTHFKYNILTSLKGDRWGDADSWGPDGAFTYVKLEKGVSIQSFEKGLSNIVEKYVKPFFKENFNMSIGKGQYYRYITMSMKDIHLYSNSIIELGDNGSALYVNMFIVIAIFILLIACINFSNLSTARVSTRAKEIGIKKSLGSSKKRLIAQFFSESIIVSLFAFFISLLLLELIVPYLRKEFGLKIALSIFSNYKIVLLFLVISIFSGVLSGIYSAIYLSSLNVVNILKGTFRTSKKGENFRNTLVIFQFSISIFLIISTLLVKKQLNYINEKDLGFKKENLLVVRNVNYLDNLKVFKENIKKLSGVINATYASDLPGKVCNGTSLTKDNDTNKKGFSFRQLIADEDYISTMKSRIIKGRDFSKKLSTDSFAVILNEKGVDELSLKNPIGAKLNFMNGTQYKVIGVIKDFHSNDFKTTVLPYVIVNQMRYFSKPNNIAIRLGVSHNNLTLVKIEKLWKQMTGGVPFSYEFMDDICHNLHKKENDTLKMFTAFSILAILIACLGLLGLVSYTTEKRIKEIGIRKSLGSSVMQIILILNKDLVRWISYSFIIAVPISWFFINSWLDNFVYKTSIDSIIFIYAGGITLFITLLTVSWQAYGAAVKNPVLALKYE